MEKTKSDERKNFVSSEKGSAIAKDSRSNKNALVHESSGSGGSSEDSKIGICKKIKFKWVC